MILLWYWRYYVYYCQEFSNVYDAVSYACSVEDDGWASVSHIEVDGEVPDLTEVYNQVRADNAKDEEELGSKYVDAPGWVFELKDTIGTKQTCYIHSSQDKDELEEMAKGFDPSRVIIKPSTIRVQVDKLNHN